MFPQLFALIIPLIVISGCCLPAYEAIPEDKEQFIGSWTSADDQVLIIGASGAGNYDGYSGGGISLDIEGGAVTITDDTINIGLFGLSRTFEITEPPYTEGGEIYMKLDGVLFTKQ